MPGDVAKCYPESYGPYGASADTSGPSWLALRLIGAADKFARPIRRRYPDPAHELMRADIRLPHADQLLIDFGCGSTDFLDAARARGWRTVGVDFNAAVVARVQSAGHVCHLADDPGWPARYQSSVARIRMNHVLEHLPDPVATLEMLHGLLEPGGALRIAVPNVNGISSRVFRKHWLGLEPRHLVLFTPPLLAEALRLSGFDTIEVEGETAAKDVVRSMQILLTGRANYGPPGSFAAFLNEVLHPLARLATAAGAPDRLQAIATR